jgi:hydroxymethylpyrimidine/phosphomethylpyrimidine kinase
VSKHTEVPAALTIAGSDSGGGAGIQADLKTFAALGVHGTSAITAITAQNPKNVLSIQVTEASILRDQIKAVTEAFQLGGVKSGMLFSVEIVEIVASEFIRFGKSSVLRIVDPVAISTSGATLLKPGVLKTLQSLLLPAASLVTPNLAEAEMLTGMGVSSIAEMRIAARKLFETYGCAALIKGGHLKRSPESLDIYFDGKTELLLQAPRLQVGKLHGTGCTYAAAIAGYAALGCDLPYAVQLAKEYITQAISQHLVSNKHVLLNHFPE